MNHHFVVELQGSTYGFEWLGYDRHLGGFFTSAKLAMKFHSVQSAINVLKESKELEFDRAIIYLSEGDNLYRIKDYNDCSIV